MTAATIGRQLVNCPSCNDNHVYPIEWEEVAGEKLTCIVRCPNCENRWTIGPLSYDVMESFEDTLDRGDFGMISLLNGFTRSNFKHDVEQLLKALDRGLIGADDFALKGGGAHE